MNASIKQENDSAAGSADLIGQLPGIIWQRRLLIGTTGLIGLVAATVTAFVLPVTYRSSALMIVQSSQLPTEVTGEGQSEIVDRRIARIRQQITSRPDLVALIEKHGLYRDRRLRDSLSEIIEDMRSAILLEPTTADLPGNLASQRTVAVRLSFDYSDPTKAQAVAQDLMQRLLELDASGNAQQASNAVQFLNDQALTLQKQMHDIEERIAQVSAANGGVLANRGVTMFGGNTGSYDVQIAQLQRDNATLIAQRDTAKSSDSRDPVVAAAETQLAAARAVYAETHPDVVMAKQRLEEAKRLAKSNTEKLPFDSIDKQIAFNNSQIAALRAAKAQEMGQMSANLSAQARAPAVEQQIEQLQQQLTGVQQQYQSVSTRLLAARAGAKAEDEQMSERLSVSEPPVVPDEPESPHRLKIIALGTAAGLGLGLALTILLEILLRPVRSPTALGALTGVPALSVIPLIRPAGSKPARRWALPTFRRRTAVPAE